MTWLVARALRACPRQDEQRQYGGGHASRCKPAHNAPIHRAAGPVHGRAHRLCRGGVEQIGADGRGRMDAKQKDENWRHERSPADAGETDQKADDKSRQRVKKIDRGQEMHDALSNDKTLHTILKLSCKLARAPRRPIPLIATRPSFRLRPLAGHADFMVNRSIGALRPPKRPRPLRS